MFHSLRELSHYGWQSFAVLFKPGYFVVIALMMSALLYYNYSVLAGGANFISHIQHSLGFYYFLYALPFAAAFLMQSAFYPSAAYLKNKWLWIFILLAPALFAIRIHFDFYGFFKNTAVITGEAQYWSYILNRLVKVLVLILPVGLVWLNKDRGLQPFYGFTGGFKWSPYFMLSLFILPIVAIASFQPAFLKTYPAAQHAIDSTMPGQFWYWAVYELCYALDFLSIESFFRGLLVIALVNICGPHSIIPAACFYCCIHFGKPMPEAISSFFGALLLGAISYHTRSIWPGLFLHISLAAMMELFCYVQHQL